MNKQKLLPTALVLIFNFCRILIAQNQTPEEILAKHLESIGPKDSREQVKNRIAIGNMDFIIKLPYTKMSGKAVIASEDKNLMIASSLNSNDYPFEKIGFFSNKINVPFISSGVRSPLGAFLLLNDKIISEGLLTGSISNWWFLLNAEKSRANIEFAGIKKINGHDAYILKYAPKGGFTSADSSIKLFFDARNFRHISSEYSQKLPEKNYQIGITGQSAIMGGSNLLVEEYPDFKPENGLTLPYTYKIHLTVDGTTGTKEFEWDVNINQYLFNQKLAANFFSFDQKRD